ncbi:MAG: cob(I)yrinic acid a,c-diamide adenosyltransferase [Candidatus Vogelbacteria bacterium]
MLYTRKGDSGTTKTLHCDQRLSKSSAIAEALGAVDELNSLLGFCRAIIKGETLPEWQGVALETQQNLFIIQAELAGASGKTITADKIKKMEKIIDEIEKELPPIKSFFIPSATANGALLDYARTVARRAERRVVLVVEEKKIKFGKFSLVYLNRLSSLLYALARLANHQSGVAEESPHYQ